MRRYSYNNFILIGITLLFLSGCAVKMIQTIPKRVETTIPELNVLSSSEVGENLVEKIRGSVYPALEVLTEINYNPFGANNTVSFKVGDKLILLHQTKSSKHYLSIEYFKRTGNNLGYRGISENKGNGQFLHSSYDLMTKSYAISKKEIDKGMVKLTDLPVPNSLYFKQEFIYNGKMGNVLKFTYREFVEDVARPAFTQDLSYDLNEGSIVGFKGLRLEVVEANNVSIKYKVLEYFN